MSQGGDAAAYISRWYARRTFGKTQTCRISGLVDDSGRPVRIARVAHIVVALSSHPIQLCRSPLVLSFTWRLAWYRGLAAVGWPRLATAHSRSYEQVTYRGEAVAVSAGVIE